MTVREVLSASSPTEVDFQRLINAFVDEFRAGGRPCRETMIAAGPAQLGAHEGLMAAVVSALCREVGMLTPPWVGATYSPNPFFAFPARGFTLRLRLMLESPPPFRARNVFVPENYLARA